MMKKSLFLLLAFLIVPAADLRSQDGNGRLFEKIFRGIAHAVASENGSPLVPPPIPYDSRAAQPEPRRTVAPSHSQPSPNRNWYQPPPVQVQPQPQRVPSYAESRAQQPRVIRQSPQQQPTQPQGPLSNWFQAPQPQSQHPSHHQGHHQQAKPQAPFSGFSPFQNHSPQPSTGHPHQGHQGHHHGHHAQPPRQPGLFGQYQPPHSSRHGHDHDEHRHHGREAHPPQEPSRVIAIRSQFQPFTIFQGQQNQRVISSRSVRPAPNQGTIVWLRTR